MLALTTDGRITECRAKVMGQGRCNHVLHQGGSESTVDFINKVNEYTETFSLGKNRESITKKKTKEEKQELSGRFTNCQFVKHANIEILSQALIKVKKDTTHNKLDNEERNSKVDDYEREVTGKVQEMFIVDKQHRDGDELHVVKNNGIVEIYNINKLKSGQNSLITKLIARPSQIKRYYTWCDCKAPKYLTDIAQENQEKGRNEW